MSLDRQITLHLNVSTRTIAGNGLLTLVFEAGRDEGYVDDLVEALSKVNTLRVQKGETMAYDPQVDIGVPPCTCKPYLLNPFDPTCPVHAASPEEPAR